MKPFFKEVLKRTIANLLSFAIIAVLALIILYDVPFNNDDYVHRIGRTGRAGLDGRAWSLAAKGADDKFVDAIETLIKKKIPVVDMDGKKKSSENRPKKTDSKSSDLPKKKSAKSSKPEKGKADNKNSNNNSGKNSKKKNDDTSDQKGFGDDVPAFFG